MNGEGYMMKYEVAVPDNIDEEQYDYYVNFNNTDEWGCNSVVDSLDYKQFGESLDPVRSDGINTQTKVKIAWTRKLL